MSRSAEHGQSAAPWWIYTGRQQPHNGIEDLPPPPVWRRFGASVPPEHYVRRELGPDPSIARRFGGRNPTTTMILNDQALNTINAALFLRRPLLVTGSPGTGKSSLAYSLAYELSLGPVLRWAITSRSTLQDGLYRYDAIGRLREAQRSQDAEHSDNISDFLRLGSLGTALLPSRHPRVLLIDELDKSDIDLPNDLLNVFEEGEFEIPELIRVAARLPRVDIRPADDPQARVPVFDGIVRCVVFPIVVVTSNGERDFPPAFLRRCVRLTLSLPEPNDLARIVALQFRTSERLARLAPAIIKRFNERRHDDNTGTAGIATDQLLNAIFLATCEPSAWQGADALSEEGEALMHILFQSLSGGDDQ